jgi:hypothetical protein
MSTPPTISHEPTPRKFAGAKGFSLASPGMLALRLKQYQRLARDTTLPPALRQYSETTAAEICAELAARRASVMGAAA